MNWQEIENLINGDPDRLINKMTELGIDFKDLNKDISRSLVKDRFGLSEQQFDAVDFVFWIAYAVEREAEELIIYPEVNVGGREKAIKALVEKLSFSQKIQLIGELYTGSKDPLVKLMRTIKELRNDVAHGRFDKLNYGGYHLSDSRGRLKLIGHYRDALLKK